MGKNKKLKEKNKSNDEGNHKKDFVAYKYSNKGKDTLYEAIILQGQPCFVTWYPDYGINNENIKLIPVIEESARIIRPPNPEEYPYTPYEYADKEELRDYFRRAIDTTIDELYQKAKDTTQKYVDQDKDIIVILAADSIFSWFQDLFPVTHYCDGIIPCLEAKVGDNHAGYIGFRNLDNTDLLADDGSMNVVVTNWLNETN